MQARDLAAPLLALAVATGLAAAALQAAEASAIAGVVGCALALPLVLAERRGLEAGKYGVFALRVALAIPLLLGFPLLGHPNPLVAALGFAWALGAAGIALGFFTPWFGLYAALAFPLALRVGGSPAYLGLALGALALAFTTDERLSLDGWLRARRGGLFPAYRVEVVLRPTATVQRRNLGKTP